ncbi:MAG: SPOR domain-containing protein [Rhodospirillales bacterium]|nr:SPOR domain-containing protein [Rhodospirillales bacterium]
MLPEGASPILKVDGEPAHERVAAGKPSGRVGMRAFGAVFAFAVIVGFGSLVAYYFVQNRDGTLDPANIPVVRADPRPMKVKPENPGGIEVPFQNTEIYDRVGQQSSGASAGRAPASAPARPGERLMPGPEAPMPRPQPPPAPVAAIPAVPEIVVPPDAVVVTPAAPARTAPAATVPPPAPAGPPPATARPIPAPPPPLAAPASTQAGAGARIQLASVRDMADAQREWARVARQYSDLLGGLAPQFVPADLGDRGVFIRVQAGPFASPEAARAACDALRARGAGCNVVR